MMWRTAWAVVAVALCGAALGGFPPPELGNWGGLARHPAVVHPAVPAADAAMTLSLRGEWEFVAKGRIGTQMRNQQGLHRHFYRQDWTGARTINVPGCWEAQGVGEPGMSECWDCKDDNSAKPIRRKFMGNGWYKKVVTLPTAWRGRRIWLKIGGVRSQGWFWVNDEQIAHVDDYCGTYKYEVTDFVKPGEPVKVVAQVNNELPARRGSEYAIHKWGGIHRDIEFEATPQTFIDEAWFRGDFDKREAELHVEVAAASHLEAQREDETLQRGRGKGRLIRVTVEGRTVERPLSQTCPNGECVVRVPLTNFRAWSPEHPNLYTGLVELVENGAVVQRRCERFGVRKIEVRGKELYLNGRPFFVRGFGDNFVHPVDGVPPPDVAFFRRHFRQAREAGFNFTRLHTRCELPEYFEAADECGILVQPELPYYCDVPGLSFAFDPVRDVTELWRNFRRYPSFAVYSMGNEGSFGRRLDAWMHQYVKAMDPDRLKINQDSPVDWVNTPANSDYQGGPPKVWKRGSRNPDRPFVCHEYLNLCVKLDSRLERKFDGVWQPPVTRRGRADWLAKQGLDMAWGDQLQNAQHVLQRTYQKFGLEAARSDPHCDGYIFWSIVDCVVEQGEAYTGQGLFDPFWGRKPGGFSERQFFAFNGPVCVLADFRPQSRIFVSGETAEVDVMLSNYGDEPIAAARAKWRIRVDGANVAQGGLPSVDVPCGPVRGLGTTRIVVPQLDKATCAEFSVSVGDHSNSWDVWLFPPRERRPVAGVVCAPAYAERLAKLYAGVVPLAAEAKELPQGTRLVIAPADSAAAKMSVAAGVDVITLAGMDGRPNVELGWWWMGTQVGMALKDHPVLAGLPHGGALTPLLFRVVKEGAVRLPVDGIGKDDLVIVGEGGEACYLYLAVKRHASGAVEHVVRGLDVLSGFPEATAILDGMVK